jgi:cytochrome c553
MTIRNILLFWTLLFFSTLVLASSASDAAFTQFKADGASSFSAEHGKQGWTKEVVSKEGEKRSCTTCHDPDITKPGKHATTKKVIEPMSASVNAERFTDLKKIEKWFKRNCEWTWGRECTAQEKGDFLKFLIGTN